jgi:hypothetical protein
VLNLTEDNGDYLMVIEDNVEYIIALNDDKYKKRGNTCIGDDASMRGDIEITLLEVLLMDLPQGVDFNLSCEKCKFPLSDCYKYVQHRARGNQLFKNLLDMQKGVVSDLW